MTHPLLTKLKITCKRLFGRCVYNWTYLKNKSKRLRTKSLKNILSNTTRANLITFTAKRWKTCIITICIFIGSYYGIGAIVSSKIDNRLNQSVSINAPEGYQGIAALGYVLKIQIDSNPWVPALPAIFPAAILDNLPNFQLGTKETIAYFIKRYAELYQNQHLTNAKKLLSYPANIWLFSQTPNDTFAPGSAKQYRKALAEIERFIAEDASHLSQETHHLLHILKNINQLLSKHISHINTYTQEHSSDFLTTRADDVFYKTQGMAYATHYLLTGLIKDYQKQIVDSEQYENITSALKSLADAVKLNPVTVKSAAQNDTYKANHLIYLAYHLLQAQNHLLQVYYTIGQKETEPLP